MKRGAVEVREDLRRAKYQPARLDLVGSVFAEAGRAGHVIA